jgi:hypothetical protein
LKRCYCIRVIGIISVVALLAASSAVVNAEDILPPVPIVPLNGMQDAPVNPSFEWSEVTNAVSYDFQLGTDPAFSAAIVDTNLASTQYEYTENDLAWDTNHYWRVRSIAADETNSNWSPIQIFHTELEPREPIEITVTPAPTVTTQTTMTVTSTVTFIQTQTITMPPIIVTNTETMLEIVTITLPTLPPQTTTIKEPPVTITVNHTESVTYAPITKTQTLPGTITTHTNTITQTKTETQSVPVSSPNNIRPDWLIITLVIGGAILTAGLIIMIMMARRH